MVRKTRKHGSNKKSKGIYSIPELRRSFEHIESYVNGKIAKRESKEKLVKDLRKEWSKVFFKDLDKKSADSFVSDRLSKKHTRRILKGGAALAGAPLDYTTRQGIYLAPGQIPTAAGHLPLSDGSRSSFGSFVPYVDKGFWNPEPGRSYDSLPIPGQIRFPTSVPAGMGSNLVNQKGGSKRQIREARKTRRRGGGLIRDMGTMLSQAFSHPASPSAPPSIFKDGQDIWYGKPVGPTPDLALRTPEYKLGSVYPKPVYIPK
jgi:hypothetical protein